MPAHTEARIRELVSAALAASTEADGDRVLPEPRTALHQHIRLAKESLGAQVVVLQRQAPD